MFRKYVRGIRGRKVRSVSVARCWPSLVLFYGELLVLLQEVKLWRDDVVGNVRALSELGKVCAILIPSRWQVVLETGKQAHGYDYASVE